MNAQLDYTDAMEAPPVSMLMGTTHVHADHHSLEMERNAQVSGCIFWLSREMSKSFSGVLFRFSYNMSFSERFEEDYHVKQYNSVW